jgi:tetratricopeptide (TPR) repeat protein
VTEKRAEGDRAIAVGQNFGIVSTGDNATNTVMQLSGVPEPAGVDAAPGTHNLPAPAKGLFVGRDASLVELSAKLGAGGGVIGQALHGLGGVGKTELALRFAHQHCAEYGLVWWVSAETEEILTDGVAGLARRLTSMPALVDGYEWAVGWLQSHTGWLLVLDNVEEPAILRNLLGAVQACGQALVTTRRDLSAPVWGKLGLAPLRLGVLDRSASVQLLVGLTRLAGQDDDAGLLAEELGDLPLALEQAASFIAQEGWTFDRYRRELVARPGRAYANTAEGFDAQRAVDRVWSLTMERAIKRVQRSEWVMSVLSWLAPEPLPTTVLSPDDDESVEVAIRVLASYNMLTRSNGKIEVHRLVQAVTRIHDVRATAHQLAAAQLLARSAPAHPRTNVDGWTTWGELLPHIDALYQNTFVDERSPDLLHVADNAATYLRAQGQLGRAIAVRERVLAEWVRGFEAGRPEVQTSLNSLASDYRAAGRVAEAIGIYEQVAADRHREFGAYHPDTLKSRSYLAYAYREVGRLSEAIELYEQVMAGRLDVLPADHPDTLATRNHLAGAYREIGRLSEAIELYERVVADRLRVLGADHPDTLNSRSNLAHAYRVAGRVAEAIELYEQVMADRLRVLGADHPNTLSSRNNLAYAYRAMGRVAEAIDLYEGVAADRLRVLGVDHPVTLTSRNNLAYAYLCDGRLMEAFPLLEQVLADRLRILGADHPGTLTSRTNLAKAHLLLGRVSEAIALYERVMADRLRVLGADHPKTLASRSDLADAYWEAGRRSEGVELYRQLVKDSIGALGNHPDTTKYIERLASLHELTGQSGGTSVSAPAQDRRTEAT